MIKFNKDKVTFSIEAINDVYSSQKIMYILHAIEQSFNKEWLQINGQDNIFTNENYCSIRGYDGGDIYTQGR